MTCVQENVTGWDRIRKFYDLNEVCMERDIVVKTTRISFFTTFVLGGLLKREEANRRVQLYTTGVTFASPSLRVSRVLDYKILAFMRHGFRWGFRAAALTGTITMAMTHLTLYRDRFSGWYAPALSGSVSFIGHRATGFFALPLGFYGCIQAATLGTLIGSTISGVGYLYALYIDGTIDDAYKKYRALCEKELFELKDYQAKITRIMKKEKLYFTFQARKRLKELEHETTLGDLDTFDDEETDKPGVSPDDKSKK